MATSRDAGYVDRCVAHLRAFVADVLAGQADTVQVVEGSFFQSTVRFLLEHQHPDGEPQRYMAESERVLSPLTPQLLYLVHRDVAHYLREQIVARKGADIISRIAAYSETTPWARERDLTGLTALVELYVHYRQLCDELVNAASMPCLIEDTSEGDWAKLHANVGSWLDLSWPRTSRG